MKARYTMNVTFTMSHFTFNKVYELTPCVSYIRSTDYFVEEYFDVIDNRGKRHLTTLSGFFLLDQEVVEK
jgi:hypothetical protein